MARTVSGPDRALGTRLYAASQHHARKARELVDSPDEHDRLDAVVHAGAALELIAKALLAEIDRCLLPDRVHHALLDAVAAERDGLAPGPVPAKNTVGGVLAVELVARLVPGCRTAEQRAKAVLSARNAAIHVAMAPTPQDLAKYVSDMEDFVDPVATYLRGSSHDYWGFYFDEVNRARAAREEAMLARARAAVAEARTRYDHAIAPLPTDLRERVLEELRTRASIVGEEMDEIDCPACGELATTAWEWDIDGEVGDLGETINYLYLGLLGMGCPVCGLRLDADEMAALGLEPEAPQPTPDDEYYRE